ncbi:16S rRNA (cytidine(1402)-2'-O)-methyltransferase [Aneurinibacillus sp. Ricciae_BoGa-3]|uniref:16S rRNA (cytidine(1402)-2'-O)-methyltransferase n=1 Tax=Aneurinibacillus sp. Ricciae_BoGa-3 TaxID=3022697 RepID=UPI00233FE783|nr:16S rRNA (cytidine(1402)-2'-O)-methyltransferase [Aneurinibacillus sp. Ricciae_BoGa-3]WCK54615.1 16S rRNA (cytidine(1402)-2'-O)-methyltransferase [Aneurinibacillus sp. Ricciae_BoGa-3]
MFIQKSFSPVIESGTLYLVATPIGNLEDMTMRAIRTLKEADIIAAEDTRQTRKLLTYFEIDTRLISYHEHNKNASGPEIIRLLKEGKQVALVSDAGLPAISDPGEDLVRMAVDECITIVPIPGANAGLSALIVSGIPTDRFAFRGFLPRDNKQRRQELERLSKYPETLIFYESPHRVTKTLKEMEEAFGNRQAALGRELTKRYEEFIRGTLAEVRLFLEEQQEVRGEFTVIVSGNSGELAGDQQSRWWDELTVIDHVEAYLQQGLDTKAAVKSAADDRGVPKREVYNQYHKTGE